MNREKATPQKIRVLIADDHAIFRAGLRLLLNAQPDIEVVGEAADGLDAVEQVRKLRPDVVLMDITMSGKGCSGAGGFLATQEIRQRYPTVKIIILTMHEEEEYLTLFRQAGVSCYILKRSAATELMTALRAVHRGEVYVDPLLTGKVADHSSEEIPHPDGMLPPAKEQKASDVLTAREYEILRYLAEGYTYKQVADRLFIGVKTVESHRDHLMKKLGLRNRADLVRYALEKGILR